jgi:16S rRNA (cytidine1402-2'-O)-methyltransferase
MAERGRLYVVATPIGNLDDLSPRARSILDSVDVIAAEDTRVTRRLLDSASSKARLVSYRDENERRMAERLVESLREGKSIALVSDAGTPAISDPGYRLVREAARAGIEVVAIPGPSALTALLSVSGLPTDRLAFDGFLPSTGAARRKAIESMIGSGRTYVLYESPRRIERLLGELAEILEDPPVAVGRELTKVHEEVLRGTATEVGTTLAEKGPRGEFAVAVHVAESEAALDDERIEREIAMLLDKGLTVRDVAEFLKERGVSRRVVYDTARRLDSER